eukprot:2338571-Pyramimonas_sp.AAC.1
MQAGLQQRLQYSGVEFLEANIVGDVPAKRSTVRLLGARHVALPRATALARGLELPGGPGR